MPDWVTDQTPAFAVIGRVNMGKSSVLATLLEIDDNEVIRISSTPGETTACQIHSVRFHGREHIRFIDTPGFSQPVEAMHALQEMHGGKTPDLATIRRFVAEKSAAFPDETRLLEPLCQGAGALYIIDPAKPLRDDFLAEMEILRWTGCPRLALINSRNESPAPLTEAWKNKLGASFNLTRTFDAHRARFDERLRLLRSLLEIDETHRAILEATITQVENEWRTRREESADIILEFLESSLSLRKSIPLETKDEHIESRRRQKAQDLKYGYFADVASMEENATARLLKIHKHHLIKADADASQYHGIDLTQKESWQKWGLSREQLAAAGAAAGAVAGLAVDAATGFFSHGVGTLLGSATGAAAAWWKGGSLPDFHISVGGIEMKTGNGKALSITPPRHSNLPWILLDSMIARYSAILARAHGRRETRLPMQENSSTGFTRTFPEHRRKTLSSWFDSCIKGSPDSALEAAAYRAILEALEDAGTS